MSAFPNPILIVLAFHVDLINFYSFQAFVGRPIPKPSSLGCIVINVTNLEPEVFCSSDIELGNTMYNKWYLYFEFKMMKTNDHQNIRDLNPTYLSSRGSGLLLSRHYSLLVNV